VVAAVVAPAVRPAGGMLCAESAGLARGRNLDRGDRVLARARLCRCRQDAEPSGGDDGDHDRGARQAPQTAQPEVTPGNRRVFCPASPGP
jgi:hypothetical protein